MPQDLMWEKILKKFYFWVGTKRAWVRPRRARKPLLRPIGESVSDRADLQGRKLIYSTAVLQPTTTPPGPRATRGRKRPPPRNACSSTTEHQLRAYAAYGSTERHHAGSQGSRRAGNSRSDLVSVPQRLKVKGQGRPTRHEASSSMSCELWQCRLSLCLWFLHAIQISFRLANQVHV